MATTRRIRLSSLHPGQAQVDAELQRFNVVCCGRRWGKTRYGIRKIAEPAIAGAPVAWFSPTHKMLAETWRELVERLGPITARRNAAEHRIELITGGLVDLWSLEAFESVRGRKYRRIIVDEAAMVPHLAQAWQAAIRPTLTDYRGDALLLSTPKGRNFFWECYQRGLDPLRPDWACWHMPTASNPFIDPGEIAAARAELPERIFAQEYLAQFLDDLGGVFRKVREAVRVLAGRPVERDHQYVIGADWGRSGDYTVFAVLDATAMDLVALDRSNRVEYEHQRGRLAALVERYDPIAVIAEENSIGQPIIERLRRERIPVQPFTTTNASKAAIVDALALAFERGALGLLDDPVLLAELQAFEASRTPSGLMRYSAPAGEHDDTVIALALALFGAQRPRMTTATIDFHRRGGAPPAAAAPALLSDDELDQLLDTA